MTEIQAKLPFAEVDWDGELDRPDDRLSLIHPYPARFIPLIPDTLLRRYAKPGMKVLDPFCGSGTSLVSAIRFGCSTTGVDLHPIACLISRVKTRNYTDKQLSSIEASANLPLLPRKAKAAFLRSIPRIDHWFSREVQEALHSIRSSIYAHDDKIEREALLCALSRIIVRVSRQESDTRYAAVENNISHQQVIGTYRRSVRDVCKMLKCGGIASTASATVFNRDIMTITADELHGPFDIVITSPPYPNAYEYWLYHKYRMYWLGFDPIAVREREIGARPHYFKKHPQTATDFERQMSSLLDLLKKATTATAPLCFVISDSIIHGEVVDNRALMTRAATGHEYTLSEATVRTIPYARKAFNPRNSPRDREHVLVFERTQ